MGKLLVGLLRVEVRVEEGISEAGDCGSRRARCG